MRGDATPATASGKTAAGEAAPHAMPAAAVRHARRGRTRLKIRFEVEHEHEREE